MKIILLHISIDGELKLIKNTGIHKLQVSGGKVSAKYILQNTIGGKKNEKRKQLELLCKTAVFFGVTIPLLIRKIAKWPHLTSLQKRVETQSSWQLSSQAYKQRNLIFMITFAYHIQICICPCLYYTYTPSFFYRYKTSHLSFDNRWEIYKVIQKMYRIFEVIELR